MKLSRKISKHLNAIEQELSELRKRLQVSEKDQQILKESNKKLMSQLWHFESFCSELVTDTDIYSSICSTDDDGKFQKRVRGFNAVDV